jgi:hypothetical protein
MIPFMSLMTAVKDYMQIVHTVVETQSNSPINLYWDGGAILTYVILSIKKIVENLLTFHWLSELAGLPQMVPEITDSLVSGVSVVSSSLGVLDAPLLQSSNAVSMGFEKLLIGVLNSVFLCLPSSISHVIIFRRFVIQGIPSGRAAAYGTIAGNLTWIACVILGCRFIIIPWLSLDWLRYLLGFSLVLKYCWDSYSESGAKRPVLPLYFAMNFLLSWTEQVTVYPFLSSLGFNAGATPLEGFAVGSLSSFMFVNAAYLFGLLLGSIGLLQAVEWFWYNPFFSLYNWMRDKYTPPIMPQYTKEMLKYILSRDFVNSVTLYFTMFAFMASLPYHALDYIMLNPLGFAHPDRMIYRTMPKTAPEVIRAGERPNPDVPRQLGWLSARPEDNYQRKNQGRRSRTMRWKRFFQKFNAHDIQLYDQGSYHLLTPEDLNFGFDRFWERRGIRRHTTMFRILPGPPLRKLKKVLAKKRVAEEVGIRFEFFERLREQMYTNTLHSPRLQRRQAPNIRALYWPQVIQNRSTFASFAKDRISYLRKFARKTTLRLRQLELAEEANNRPVVRPNTRLNNLVFNKYVKWHSQYTNAGTSDLTTGVLSNNLNLAPLQTLQRAPFNKQGIDQNLHPVLYAELRDATHLQKTAPQSARDLSRKILSRGENQILRYSAAFKNVSSVNSANAKSVGSLNSMRLSQPIDFYVQREQALERKWLYYRGKVTRQYVAGQSSTFLRVLLNRVFLFPRANARWYTTKQENNNQANSNIPTRPRRKPTRRPLKWSFAKTDGTLQKDDLSKQIGSSLPTKTNGFAFFNALQKSRLEKPTENYRVNSVTGHRYRHQILRHTLESWYYQRPLRRFLMAWDIDAFMRRQPRSYWLNPFEEKLLHVRRGLLLEHYNGLRWYRSMQHYASMKRNTGGIKSAANSLYQQQFQGTLRKVRHLFALTPSQNDRRWLSFDQPLYNEYANLTNEPLVQQSWWHEELKRTPLELPLQNTVSSFANAKDMQASLQKLPNGEGAFANAPGVNIGATRQLAKWDTVLSRKADPTELENLLKQKTTDPKGKQSLDKIFKATTIRYLGGQMATYESDGGLPFVKEVTPSLKTVRLQTGSFDKDAFAKVAKLAESQGSVSKQVTTYAVPSDRLIPWKTSYNDGTPLELQFSPNLTLNLPKLKRSLLEKRTQNQTMIKRAVKWLRGRRPQFTSDAASFANSQSVMKACLDSLSAQYAWNQNDLESKREICQTFIQTTDQMLEGTPWYRRWRSWFAFAKGQSTHPFDRQSMEMWDKFDRTDVLNQEIGYPEFRNLPNAEDMESLPSLPKQFFTRMSEIIQGKLTQTPEWAGLKDSERKELTKQVVHQVLTESSIVKDYLQAHAETYLNLAFANDIANLKRDMPWKEKSRLRSSVNGSLKNDPRFLDPAYIVLQGKAPLDVSMTRPKAITTPKDLNIETKLAPKVVDRFAKTEDVPSLQTLQSDKSPFKLSDIAIDRIETKLEKAPPPDDTFYMMNQLRKILELQGMIQRKDQREFEASRVFYDRLKQMGQIEAEMTKQLPKSVHASSLLQRLGETKDRTFGEPIGTRDISPFVLDLGLGQKYEETSSGQLQTIQEGWSQQPSPLYAGWDESLRKFVLSNRLKTRMELRLAEDEFEQFPLKGFNVAPNMGGSWNVPMVTFAALSSPQREFAFAPMGWRRLQLRHVLIQNWQRMLGRSPLQKEQLPSLANTGSTNLANTSISVTIYGADTDALKQSRSERLKQIVRTYRRANLAFWNKPRPWSNVNTYKNLVPSLATLRIPNYTKPMGKKAAEVLPNHVLWAFWGMDSRANSARYMGPTPTVSLPAGPSKRRMRVTGPAIDFTLRRRPLPKRRLHRIRPKHSRKEARLNDYPRRRTWLRDVDQSKKRWRPGMQSTPIAINQPSMDLTEKRKGKRLVRKNMNRYRRTFPSQRTRVIPLPGGALWPGDYERLQAIPVSLDIFSQLRAQNFPTESVGSSATLLSSEEKKVPIRRSKAIFVPTKLPEAVPTGMYLAERHNVEVLKKRLSKTGHPSAFYRRIWDPNLTPQTPLVNNAELKNSIWYEE